MRKDIVIAIDGPSGAGKSTVSKMLAKLLGFLYIDTGAMYRAAALKAEIDGVSIDDEDMLAKMLDSIKIEQKMGADGTVTYLDGVDVSEKIRDFEIGIKASLISAKKSVRGKLVHLQREMGKCGGVILEGRDIGTFVFPYADIKFYLTASDEERARRRWEELNKKGDIVGFEEVLKEIRLRDKQDSTRELAPLKMADDAILIDSTELLMDNIVFAMMKEIEQKIK